MMIVSVLTVLAGTDVQPWMLGAVVALRLATATIGFAVALHRGIRYFRKK